jgi:hypothetical protein
MSKCACTMRIRILGDGCRYCQPQFYIDSLDDLVSDLLEKQDHLEQELRDRPV